MGIPKYRAWDTSPDREPVMVKVLVIDFAEKYCWVVAKGGKPYVATFDTLKLLQYIGLKDKNDAEVYEDDIVRYSYDHKKNYPSNQRRVVAWQTNGYNKNGWNTANGENLEIIGNIHENPEIIK